VIEDLPDVPPAVQLLVSEVANCDDRSSARKRIKSILGELRIQSAAYLYDDSTRTTAVSKPLEFEVHLHGGLDLFDTSGACMEYECRIRTADRLARSMGLIADRMWISDFISEQFIDFGRATNEKLDAIVNDALVLCRLWPLVSAGILRFRTPSTALCSDCLSEFNHRVELVSREIGTKFVREIKITTSPDGSYSAKTGRCFEPAMWMFSSAHIPKRPTRKSIVEEIVRQQVSTALWVGREASTYGGSIFSNSRIGLAGLLHQEGRLGNRKQLTLLDNERSMQVPWVSELTCAQILELRQEASHALPVFRERMAKALSITDNMEPNSLGVTEFVQELREQAAAVRAELKVTQQSSGRFWKTSYGLLGLGISAYGVATDQVMPGMAGLLPLINLLINHASGHEKEISTLTSRPGYVLVKAQDILAHDH
jgi:hypothetical protein